MPKKVYIAGKVTGTPITECTLKFGNAQKVLEKSYSYDVVNPLTVVNDWHCPWPVAMKKCIMALLTCDVICMLPDWQDSIGARTEHLVASRCDMEIFFMNNENEIYSLEIYNPEEIVIP